MSNNFGKLFKSEARALAESVFRNGSSQIGGRLLDAVSDVTQPNDIAIGNIVAALRNGAIATGQQVLMERLRRR
ncbi:hypothetical protein D3P08_06685 [Paenibacillus nanensis]|uniref:Uncharacterized protein n=1 Tax=Paenibacillus nanensis TaxID=393251 RepID=A0A3A1UZL6_9BACL|nr:hypothetical protein [Paenibacillus nanensis]RIX53937.1 hypothetical protein D3P08_06685 [Paenibacillus nanensis]